MAAVSAVLSHAQAATAVQELGCVPEAEWEEYRAAIRRKLPTTFRITGTRR